MGVSSRETCGVSVCLCTYNGERHIRAQIESVLQQLGGEDELIVSDDGSSDRTIDVVRAIVDPRIRVVANGGRRGPIGNFSNALAYAKGRYVFLADQDDIWASEKVCKSLEAMASLEVAHGPEAPMLVFSDSLVVSEDLTVICGSFMQYERLEPGFSGSYKRTAIQNVGQGCTFLLNRALVDLAIPIPDGAKMHDHWIMLVAALFGKTMFLAEPLVHYRQHGGNVVGSQGYDSKRVVRKALSGRKAIKASIVGQQRQARCVVERYGPSLTSEQYSFFSTFGSLVERWWGGRKVFCIAHGLRMTTFARTVGFYVFV